MSNKDEKRSNPAKEFIYEVKEIPLGANLTDELMSFPCRTMHIVQCPIDIDCKINAISNDAIPLATVRGIIGDIQRIFLTTITTSSDNLIIIVSNEEAFQAFSSGDLIKLITPSGIEYDSRVPKSGVETIDDEEIRNTNLYTSSILNFSTYAELLITYDNSLDKDLTLKLYGSLDGVNYFQIGSDITVTTGSSDYMTLSEAWAYVRITAQAGTNPTSGKWLAQANMRT